MIDSDEQSSQMYFFSIDRLDNELLVSASRALSTSYVIVWNYMNGKQLNKYKISESVSKIEVIQRDFIAIAGKSLYLWNLTAYKIEKFALDTSFQVSIDLFLLFFVFKREQAKAHFVLKIASKIIFFTLKKSIF